MTVKQYFELTELKPSIQKSVLAWAKKQARINDIKELTDLSTRSLGEDFLQHALQWKAQWSFYQFTMGQLVDMLDNLSSICQFEVSTTKVEQIIAGPDGVFKAKGDPLYMPIEVLCLRGKEGQNDEFAIGGGRHRVMALATVLRQYITDWRDMYLTCSVATFGMREDLIEYIKHSNGSRSMTTTEKDQLKLGMSYTSHSAADFFAAALEDGRNLTESKSLTAYAVASKMTELRHIQSGEPLTIHTCVDLAKSFTSKFLTKVNKYLKEALADDPDVTVKNPTINKLIIEATVGPDGQPTTYLRQVLEYMVYDLTKNWNEYYSLTAAVKDGKQTYLFAYYSNKVATALADKLSVQFADNLVGAYKEYVLNIESQKAEQREAKAAKRVEANKSGAVVTLNTLYNSGVRDASMFTAIIESAKLTAADVPTEVAAVLQPQVVAQPVAQNIPVQPMQPRLG